MNLLNNPLLAMGTGLLSSSGPSLDPGQVSLGRGLGAGLNSLNAMRQQQFQRQLLAEKLRAEREAQSMKRQEWQQKQAANAQQQRAVQGLLKIAEDSGNPNAELARGLIAAGEIGPAIKLLQPQEAPGLFEGTAMEAQAYNTLNEVASLRSAGKPIPPALARKAQFAERYLMTPKPAGFDPITGQAMYTQPPPLPSVGGPQAPQQAPRPPAASQPATPAVTPQASQAPGSGRNTVLGRGPVGRYLNREELVEAGFPPDALVQIVRSKGGVRSFDVQDKGASQTEGERQKAGQVAIVDEAMGTIGAAIESGVDLSSASAQLRDYAAGAGAGPQIARSGLETFGKPQQNREVANVAAAIETVSNNLIALMRGAQVGPAEQEKFERQLPRIGQARDRLKANYDQTQKNIDVLKRRYKEVTGKDFTTEGQMTLAPGAETDAPRPPSAPSKPADMTDAEWQELQTLRQRHGR